MEGALALPGLSGTDLVPAVTKQGGLSMAPAECAPPRPTAQARPAEGRQGPPACTPLDGDGALAGGVEDAAREAGTQGSTPGRGTEGADDPPENLASGSVESQGEEGALRRPIRPWLCPDGSTHKELLHNLCRRIVGLIFNLPGVSQVSPPPSGYALRAPTASSASADCRRPSEPCRGHRVAHEQRSSQALTSREGVGW